MAYDPLRERLVLYGGFNGAVALGDTWLYDGLRWTQQQPSERPPVLLGAAMAWDPIGESLVMYGGASAFEGQPQSDTWSWDGSNWTKLTPGQSPGPLKEHRMATDTKRDRIVLFGGIDFETPTLSPVYANRTWEWTGGNWIFQDRLLVPAARADFAMAFDSIRGLTVVAYGTAGRTGSTQFGDTWIWDGSVWRDNAFLDPKPRARGDVRLVENSNTGRLMMYGGKPAGNEPLSNARETWEFFGPGIAQAAPFGAGCPGASGLAPLLASLPGSRPQLGSVFEVEFRDLPIAPGTATLAFWGLSSEIWKDTQFALPDDLDWIGMPNCDLLVSLDHLVPLSTTGSIASWTLNIPSDIGLVGFEFFLQGLILDPGANALGLITSNGIRGKVGVQ